MQRISPTTWLVLILLAGLILRGGLLWRQFDRLAEDPDGYRAIARHLAAGEGFVHPKWLTPTAYRPPAYPLLLAAIFKTGGDRGGIAVLHLILGGATILLTYAAGGRLGLGACRLVAAGIVAVDPLLLQYTPQVMTEVAATFFVALLFWLIARGPDTPPPGRGRLFATGIVFAMAAMCRPTLWAFGALAAAWWVMRKIARREVITPWPVLLGAALIAAPWVVRNAIVLSRPILATTHGGYTLLLGNNPVYYDEVVRADWGTVWSGDSLDRWQRQLETDLKNHDPPITTEIARDRWMYDRAKQNIAADPGGFARAAVLRLGRGLWGLAPVAAADSPGRHVLKWGVGTFYAALFAAGLWGLCTLKRDDWRFWMPAVLLLAAFTLVHTCYWANVRMRAPLMPVVALLAARGISVFLSRRNRSLKMSDASHERREFRRR